MSVRAGWRRVSWAAGGRGGVGAPNLRRPHASGGQVPGPGLPHPGLAWTPRPVSAQRPSPSQAGRASFASCRGERPAGGEVVRCFFRLDFLDPEKFVVTRGTLVSRVFSDWAIWGIIAWGWGLCSPKGSSDGVGIGLRIGSVTDLLFRVINCFSEALT